MTSANVTRTTALIKARGNRYRIEQRWNQYAGEHGQREDMWGIIDLLEFDPKSGVNGIQVCGTDFGSHWKKMTVDRRDDSLYVLGIPGMRLFIYSWRKLKVKRGGKAVRWKPRIVEITLKDLGVKI